jgi:hypothetical protein
MRQLNNSARNILAVLGKLSAEIKIAYIAIVPIVLGACITLLQGNYHLGDMIFTLGNQLATFCCLLYLISNGEFRKTIFWKLTLILLSVFLFEIIFFQIQDWPYRPYVLIINYVTRLGVFFLYLFWFYKREKKKIKEILKLIWVILTFLVFTVFPGNNFIFWFMSSLTLLLIVTIEVFEKYKYNYHQQ